MEECGSITGPPPYFSLRFRKPKKGLSKGMHNSLVHARLYLGQLTKVVNQLTVTEAMAKNRFEVVEFPGSIKRTMAEAIESLVSDYGVVYITSLTRKGCSGCEEQKPLFEDLAAKMSNENSGKVKFRRVHMNYHENDQRDSWDSKRIFGHAAYPTYMVHVKSHVGPLEIYRAVYPSMDQLERQIKDNLELAEFYKTEAEKAQL